MELLKKEQKVCVQIDNYTPDLSSYRFVSLCGTLEKVTDTTEYGSVVKIFSDIGKKELSAKFFSCARALGKDQVEVRIRLLTVQSTYWLFL
jgi:nitroimidazol reductase NimA-like FMN-containing flavoprotein (pyridoxamine 5'-phosphate oxidase superfamily)